MSSLEGCIELAVELLRNLFSGESRVKIKSQVRFDPKNFLAEMLLRCLLPSGSYVPKQPLESLRKDMQDRAGETEYPRSLDRVPPSAAQI